MENNDIHKELQDLNSPLAKMEKKSPFEVPANYFEELPENVQSHISNRRKMLPVWQMPKFWLRWTPAFAMIIVLFGVATYMLSPKNASVQDNILASQKTEILVNEVSANDILLDEIDEELLVETYSENVKTQENVFPVKQSTKVKNADLEEYILENYDESLLIEEL
jgi:hypothetical protein